MLTIFGKVFFFVLAFKTNLRRPFAWRLFFVNVPGILVKIPARRRPLPRRPRLVVCDCGATHAREEHEFEGPAPCPR
jgi:hypothetical protein